ncbi:hypothetical protein BCR34DRAFT_654101 [Clohesyomyces aquaticus]|uniref:Uncharacterized protein n=1 Tax=Clohesyomyces aquaticus TaxID=1231657 RepID=A0A1Y1ZKC7_9PLEO|nr:hypothetical protein BCR34DRAFT_654101 [Clohesyomyces aquaticus]
MPPPIPIPTLSSLTLLFPRQDGAHLPDPKVPPNSKFIDWKKSGGMKGNNVVIIIIACLIIGTGVVFLFGYCCFMRYTQVLYARTQSALLGAGPGTGGTETSPSRANGNGHGMGNEMGGVTSRSKSTDNFARRGASPPTNDSFASTKTFSAMPSRPPSGEFVLASPPRTRSIRTISMGKYAAGDSYAMSGGMSGYKRVETSSPRKHVKSKSSGGSKSVRTARDAGSGGGRSKSSAGHKRGRRSMGSSDWKAEGNSGKGNWN